ncbi:nuclear pore complex protein Nup214-like isoform X3 [Sinocyclocheilus rhinocerous]|uniref:nuclear pore complex protein Nup214-like isoform X3 n=1 Tax=Sinocyclocheilus rhinocerous TaxID=307959 RepID=UPI0007B7E627|nr:PREDICTED: nuclear pore complex protein Nup214-like isoform X3 [Sinocyclocheilus rhinocerous]
MGDDPDSIPEREMKVRHRLDFQFRQMKKIRVFESSADLPKERSSLLAISNKYGLTFVGKDETLKVFWTRDVIAAGRLEGNPNDTVECSCAVMVTVGVAMHHMALSSDELTLSVCGMGDTAELTLDFYDVRTFLNKDRQEKRPFTSFKPAAAVDTLVQDLKWSPVDASRLAVCLSDGSMMVLDVQDSVSVVAQLPASEGITCVCWSPKGKQVSAGKEDATVVQFTPTLQAKKVIPCPSFYSQDHPVKVLDVLWLSTYNFAVAYAAADGSLETPPELVVVSLPKKDEKRDEHYLNFNDLVYGTCTERQHHYYLCHIEDWDLVLASSAAAIEVSIIAKQEDKVNWELWLLEDASRAELPVTENSEDTLPVGMAIDYTSQEDIHLSDEKRLPPAPTLMLLSTDGVLCPFSLLNLNPGVKQLTVAAVPLPEEGERAPAAKSLSSSVAPASAASSIFPSFPASSGTALPPATLSFTAPPPAATAATSLAPPTSASSTGFSFSLPALGSTTSSGFSLGSATGGFSFSAPKPSSDAPAFSFASSLAPKEVSSAPAATPPQRPPAMSPIISGPKAPAEPATPAIRMNLTDRFLGVDSLGSVTSAAQPFSLTSTPKPAAAEVSGPMTAALKPAAPAVLSRAAQSSASPAQPKPAAVAPPASRAPSAQVMSVKALEKNLQQKKDSDPVMTGILEEIGHFEKELDDLKTRCRNADFRVGSTDDMRDLRKDSENLHAFTLEIKDATESLHGDISALKTSLLEGFAGAEEARAQSELNRDKDYLQLLYKKPLDPRREEQLKEIRRLYQYVKFAMEDVNDVLDVEWEKHLEKKKKLRHMIIPEREALFAALANNLDIINQQKQRLDRLESDLHKLRLYRGTSVWSFTSLTPSTPSGQSLDSELESLKDALLKASLETTPKAPAKSPSKMTPAKQSQLRNFLSKRQTPPVHSTAPANLSRSAFLSPQFYEDLDEVSSSSSLSQPLEPEDSLALAEEEDEPAPIPVLMPSVPRHPAVVRTPSIQPGFSMQSSPFSRVQTVPIPVISPAPRINMDSADSTALATKTVKHGAPPTEKIMPTTIPAPQAAGRAALSRHMTSQKPGASLTESTLKTVPQVVNVQELKDEGPPIPVSTVISASVPAQVIQQVLATVEANKNSFQGVLNVSAPLAGPAQTTSGGAAKTDAGASSSISEKNSKGFSFTAMSSGFSFAPPSQDTNNTQAKSSGLPGKFSFASSTGTNMTFGPVGSEEPFSFTSKLSSPAQSMSSSTQPPELSKLPQAPKAQGNAGETLGSFSGLRVGQSEEGKEAPKTTLGFTFGQPGNGSTGFAFSSAQIKLAETGSSSESTGTAAEAPKMTTAQGFGSSTFTFKPQEGTAPSFTIPSTSSFPPAATSFSSLLRAPLSETQTLPTKSLQSETTTSTEPAPSADTESKEPPAEPSPKPPTLSAPSAVPVTEAAAPTSNEPTTAPSNKPPTPPALEVSSAPPPLVTPPSETPAPVSEPPAAEPVSDTAPETTTTSTSTTTPAPQETPATTPSSAPTSEKPGSIFAPTSGGTDSLTVGAINLTSVVTSAASSAPSAAITTSAAPTPVFGQPTSAAPTTVFGSTIFGANSTTSGFGKPAFGQSSSAGFGQPAASGSASGFSFGQQAFSASSGFGQPAAATTTSATNSGGGGLFGSSSTNSASSFSFVASATSSAASSGTGFFGQSSAPVFGQSSSGFGQGSMFGSNTTTASSTGFGFGQQPVFGSNTSTSSVFGQQASGAGVFGQAQSGGSLFGSNTGNTSSGSGFFSGLGGKPSEDAANKNPFGTPAAGGFGQPINTGPSNLFGNSGAKGFSFGNSSFGEQKPSGSFSSGTGSVAAQGFGSFSTPTKPAGFGSAPVFGSPPTFGGSPAFGGSAGFGSAPSFGSPQGSSSGKVFGEGTTAANVGGFGFASPQSAPSFGSLAGASTAPSFGGLAQQQQQPPGFGAQSGAFSGFGSSGGFGGFGNTSTNQPSSQTFNSWRS